jgi:hypothetical protein
VPFGILEQARSRLAEHNDWREIDLADERHHLGRDDPSTNVWTTKALFSGMEGFGGAINGVLYAGGGQYSGDAPLFAFKP